MKNKKKYYVIEFAINELIMAYSKKEAIKLFKKHFLEDKLESKFVTLFKNYKKSYSVSKQPKEAKK